MAVSAPAKSSSLKATGHPVPVPRVFRGKSFTTCLFWMWLAILLSPFSVTHAQQFRTNGNTNLSSALNSAYVAGTNNLIASNANAAFIGSGLRNEVQSGSEFATIPGGRDNRIFTNTIAGSIGGGRQNTVSGSYALITGGYSNQASGTYAAILGGSENSITGQRTIILGGHRNTAAGFYGAALGGQSNSVSASYGLTLGGLANNVSAAATGGVAAGHNATASHRGVFVWASYDTNGSAFSSTGTNQFLIRAAGGVGINTNNPGTNALSVRGSASISGNLTVSGTINGTFSNATFSSLTVNGPILSGTGNSITGPNAAVGGGQNNTASEVAAVIGGGASNSATGSYSSIGGGQVNTAFNTWSTVGGGFSNRATGLSSFVGGGEQNLASAKYSAVGAGAVNQATAEDASVFAGFFNKADADQTFVGGGQQNRASGPRAVVVGGHLNEASAPYSSVAGGSDNLVLNTANGGVIGGGEYNTVGGTNIDGSAVGGTNAVVPGGSDNQASGTASFAAGVNAKAVHDYSFVWGGSPDVDTVSTTSGEFAVRSPGGAKFITSDSGSDAGVVLPANGTGWSSLSDSNAKTGITAIDHRETLRKVAALPITSWQYKHDPKRRYIGPMAQDFHATFGLGSDDKHISTLDTDGVTLSAIKGLVEELREQDQALDARDQQIEALERAVETMRESIADRSF